MSSEPIKGKEYSLFLWCIICTGCASTIWINFAYGKKHTAVGNVFYTASSACLLCVKTDGCWIPVLAGEIPALRQWGFKLSGEKLFLVSCWSHFGYSGCWISAGDQKLCLGKLSPARHNARGCWIAGISSCYRSMVLRFSNRQVLLSKTLLILRCASSRCEDPKPLLFSCLDDTFSCGAVFMESYLGVTDLPDSAEVQPCASWTWIACAGSW